MQGHIRKRGNAYCIVVELEKDPTTGKRRQKWFSGFKTKKQAQEKLPEILLQIQSGEQFENKELFLREYLVNWINTYAKYNVSPRTYIFYDDIIRKTLIPNLGNMQISKLKPLQIQSFLSSMLEDGERSTTTVRHYYDVLNITLNQAVKWQIINNNPCTSVEPPKNKSRQIKILTPDQVNTLLEYTKTCEFSVMYIPVHIALTCGMRRGEILGLKWDDIDLDNGVLHISNNLQLINNELVILPTKTDLSQRSIALLTSSIATLRQHRKEQQLNKLLLGPEYNNSNFVCSWPNGKPIRPDYVTKTLKKLLRKCNLPDIRFHDLRHVHATLLLLEGVNPKIVAERLGHSKVTMTLDTYSHVLPQMQKEAADKLDKKLFSK